MQKVNTIKQATISKEKICPVDKTYIVNLRRRADKRQHMESELARINAQGFELKHEFLDAVDGADKSVTSQFKYNIPEWRDPNSNKAMTQGEIGCALSHYVIWKRVVDDVANGTLNSDCKILVLEDDVIFLDNFGNRLRDFMSELETFDLLYVHRKPLALRNEKRHSTHIHVVAKSYWTCGYVITHSGAQKLVASNYLDNLIPADEFLPIMYGCDVMGFEQLFQESEKISAYSCMPSLLKLTANAFSDSETFHSEPATITLNHPFSYPGGDGEFQMILIAPGTGDSHQRFISHAKIYGIPLIVLHTDNTANTMSLLQTCISGMSDAKQRLLMVCITNDFTNILPVTSPAVMLEKYIYMARNREVIVPNVPTPGDTLSFYFGWADSIDALLFGMADSTDLPVEVRLALMTYSGNLIVDSKNEIFLCTDHADIEFQHKSSTFRKKSTNASPCIAYSSNHQGYLRLNQIENYTGNGWNEYYGYQLPRGSKNGAIVPFFSSQDAKRNVIPDISIPRHTQDSTTLPKIYVAFHVKNSVVNLNFASIIDYPKDCYIVTVNRSDSIPGIPGKISIEGEILHDNEEAMWKNIISSFLESDCDYFFFIDHNTVLTNPDTLRKLLEFNKPVVTPFIKKKNGVWSNFWGALKDNGYYDRSFDYFNIVNGERRGCWNMPYVMGIYLMQRNILESVTNLLTDNAEMDIDMRIAHNLRADNKFMYVSNLVDYGYVEEDVEVVEEKPCTAPSCAIDLPPSIKLSLNNLADIKDKQSLINNILSRVSNNAQIPPQVGNGELTIFDFYTRRQEWERKYLHPEFLPHINNWSEIPVVELCENAFNYPFFSQDFCKELIAKMESYGKWSKGKDEHADPRLGTGYYENVPTQDIQLFEIKFDRHWNGYKEGQKNIQGIVGTYVAPMARRLYSFYKTKGVNLAFVVRYHWEQQAELTDHHDASSYTVNIALNTGGGVDYDGGGCHFVRQNYSIVNQLPGMCVMHPGRLTHYHRGLKTTSGIRYIMVSFID